MKQFLEFLCSFKGGLRTATGWRHCCAAALGRSGKSEEDLTRRNSYLFFKKTIGIFVLLLKNILMPYETRIYSSFHFPNLLAIFL